MLLALNIGSLYDAQANILLLLTFLSKQDTRPIVDTEELIL